MKISPLLIKEVISVQIYDFSLIHLINSYTKKFLGEAEESNFFSEEL